MHAERTRLRPYPLPDLTLPAQSEWLSTFDHASAARSADFPAMRGAIGRLAREQQQAIEHFETSLSSPAAFSAWLADFAGASTGIAALAGSDKSGPNSAQPSPAIDESDRRGKSHAIYDRFFRVTREPGLSQSRFAATLLEAYARVLLDLPYSTIARHEMLYLLRSMTRSLSLLSGEESNLTVIPFAPAHGTGDLERLISDSWAICDVDPDWLTHVADHRWISGHHLFFLFANLCRVSLDLAAQALAEEKLEALAQHLIDAGLFQRSFASAMWYAGDFPPSLYRSHTRPWMATADAANGFSGSDNIDYADLHKSRETLVNALFAAFGSDADQWPAAVEQALRSFHEMETQHAEHHVLIAARMVGMDTSLVQKRMTRAVYNAVDVLRDMVAEEWTELANRFA